MASSVASISSSNVPFGPVLRHQSENNILKLKLRKPKSWNWELSTSKSSLNIDFPRILLYDSNNKLLADVDEANFIVNGKENEPYTPVPLSLSEFNRKNRLKKSRSFSASNLSVNSARNSSIVIHSDRSDDRYSSLKSDSSFKTESKSTRSHSIASQCTLHNNEDVDESMKNGIDVSSSEDKNLPEVPIYIYSAKGLIKRDFNAKEFDEIRNRQNSLDSGKNVEPLIVPQDKIKSFVAKDATMYTITDGKKEKSQSTTECNTNPLIKCPSMAEILVNGKPRPKNSRQKIRRTKSANLSSSSKCQTKNMSQKPTPIPITSSSSSSSLSTMSSFRKPVYHIQKSAAGSIIVPEEKTSNRRVRHRHRLKSLDKLDRDDLLNCMSNKSGHHLKPVVDDEFPSRNKTIAKTDNFKSNVILSHELNSVGNNVDDCCINDINEITASVDSENDGIDKNCNEHLVSIKTENNQPNVKNGRASSANSNNNINNGNDGKQKKVQVNRKVSFVQFNCEKSDAGCNSNECNNDSKTNNTNTIIHNDWIDVQLCDDSHQNGKCINTRATNGRKKVFHGKIKKSASVSSFCNDNNTTSDSDDNYDTYAMQRVRHKKRRFSQRPKSTSSTYQHRGDEPAVSHLQRNSDNVISNSSDKESLVKFEENLAKFQNQWAFDKCERNRSGAILDDLYENGRKQTYNSNQCDTSTTSLTVTPIINNDNNFYDNVTTATTTTTTTAATTKNTNKNNHLNYRYQKVYQDGTDKTGYFTNTFFINTIKENEQYSGNYSKKNNKNNNSNNIELKEKSKYKQNQQRHVNNMGSNVSRNTAKGLSGRRAQSSGDLTNGNVNKSNNEREHQIAIEAQANDPNLMNDEDQVDTLCPTPDISQLMNVKKSERNKFFGSLPNHLDSDETYRENIYNKSNTQEIQKRPFEKNKLGCDSIQYPSSSPRGLPYSQTSHHQNAKSSNGIETAMHLKLAINRSNVDVGCDQGYGSERSPEEELPPILSIPYQSIDAQAHPQYHQKPVQRSNGEISESDFSFITKDCCFTVQVIKNERGLGISVYGGVDSAPNVAFRGLIRIKRLFPNQAAWSTGMLQPGDILLEANNIPLTGLTNHEALEVLRTAPNLVILSVCRPHDEQFRKLSPPADPPRPPQRSLHTTTTFEPQSPTLQTAFIGEFEITMVKQQGSLGFTLRKEDESVLGHYVRALIRDPAASDGRIKPGDKIVAVNDVPLCPMTHEEAVIFLRQANDRVKLRLYRDNSQTPIASISPSSSEQYISSAGKPKASLRPEAMNLLIDLAHKNRKQSCDSYSTGSSAQSNSASPTTWRLRRNNNNNNNINKVNSNDNNAESCSENEKSASKSFDYQNQTYTVTMQSSSVCSDSETSTISQSSFVNQTLKQAPTCDNRLMNGTFTVEQFKQSPPPPQQQQQPLQQRPCGEDSEYYNEEELWRLMDVDECGTTEHPDRPNLLDIGGSSGCTPVVSRKPMFQFSAANGYELNNLDNEALDAPVYNSMCNNPNLNNQPYQDGINNDFTSLPCETFLLSSRVNSNCANDENEKFSYKNPVYQSAHVQVKSKPILNDEEIYHIEHPEEDEGDKTMAVNVQTPETTTSSEPDSSCATMIEINPIAADNANEINPLDRISFDDTTHEIITVELSRGWNSRLGFSLRNEPNTMQTTISAIYNDSVAAKDGRLKVGDKILMVNDESVEGMTTGEIIDLLRIIRGSIVLVVKRPRC